MATKMSEPAPQFAEYQYSVPEVYGGAPKESAPVWTGHGGSEPLPEGAGFPRSDEERDGKRRILGMAPVTIIVACILVVLVLVGVIVGAVVGSRHSGHHTTTQALPQSRTSSASATSSPTPSASPIALAIISAVYAAVNDTTSAISAMQQGQYISLNMSNTAAWAGSDPWFGVHKCLGLLHSYGSSIRTFVACDFDGPFTLVPGNVNLSPRTQEITRQGPSSPNFALVSVVWGAAEIRNDTLYQTLYQYKSNGSAVPFENWLFGQDTLVGWSKSGVIWYTQDNFVTFKGIFGREGDSVPF